MEPAFERRHMACAESLLLLDADEVVDLACEHEVEDLDPEAEEMRKQKPALKSGAIEAAKANAAELKHRRSKKLIHPYITMPD